MPTAFSWGSDFMTPAVLKQWQFMKLREIYHLNYDKTKAVTVIALL